MSSSRTGSIVPTTSERGGAAVSCVFRDHVAVGPDRVRLRRLGCRRRRRRLRRPAGGGGPAVRGHRRGRGPAARHPGRRERVGAFRRQRPPVSPGAVRPAVRPSRAADRDDGRGVREPGGAPEPSTHLSRVVDRRQLLHLDWPPGRPDCVEPAGRRPRGDRDSRRRRRRRRSNRPARSCSSPKAATGSGGTGTITPRTTTRSSTTCSGGTCGTCTACCSSRCRRSSSSATSRRPWRSRRNSRRRRGCSPTIDGEADELLRMAGRRHIRGRRPIRARCTRPAPAARILTRVHFGFSASHLFVRLDGDGGWRTSWRRVTGSR